MPAGSRGRGRMIGPMARPCPAGRRRSLSVLCLGILLALVTSLRARAWRPMFQRPPTSSTGCSSWLGTTTRRRRLRPRLRGRPDSDCRGENLWRPRRRHRHRPEADRGISRERQGRRRRASGGIPPRGRADGRRVARDRRHALHARVGQRGAAPGADAQLRPGARIVSHAFSMGPSWPADKIDQFTSASGDEVTLYLWKADGKIRP